MSRSRWALAAILMIAGCNDAPAAPDDGDDGGAAADAGADAGTGESDAGTPVVEDDGGANGGEDAAPAADAGSVLEGEVLWVTETEPIELDSDTGLDFAFQYEVQLSGNPYLYTLTLERCSILAGHDPACEPIEEIDPPASSRVRWGVDPSNYSVGENHYTFHLVLSAEGEVLSEDTLDFELNVTACTECVD